MPDERIAKTVESYGKRVDNHGASGGATPFDSNMRACPSASMRWTHETSTPTSCFRASFMSPDEPRFEHVCNTVARPAVDFLHTDPKASRLLCLCLKKR